MEEGYLRFGAIGVGGLMWDDKRKVRILNDFDFARATDQTGASGKDNTGTLPFVALYLLSKEGLCGDIHRRYRHDAESFTWSLICLCLATMLGKGGKNYIVVSHPLWVVSRSRRLFTSKRGSNGAISMI